jgi:type II secretory pathway component PulJ
MPRVYPFLLALICFSHSLISHANILIPDTTHHQYIIASDEQTQQLLQLADLLDARLKNLQALHNLQTPPHSLVQEFFIQSEQHNQHFLETLFFVGFSNNLLVNIQQLDNTYALHYPLIASHAVQHLLMQPVTLLSENSPQMYAFSQLLLLNYQVDAKMSTNDPLAFVLASLIQAKKQNLTTLQQQNYWKHHLTSLEQEQTIDQLIETLQPIVAVSDQIEPTMQKLLQSPRNNAFYKDIISQSQRLLLHRIEGSFFEDSIQRKTQIISEASDFDTLFMQEFNARFQESLLPSTLKSHELKQWDFPVLMAFLLAQHSSLEHRYAYILEFFEIRELVFLLLESQQDIWPLLESAIESSKE